MSVNECPIVILHGWGSSAKRWDIVKQSLEEKGYSVFVPDLPGFGQEPTPDRPWGTEDYVDWVYEWTEKRSLSRFFLAGHSFGGAIAALFAARYPDKVVKLILIAPAIRRQKKLKQRFLFLFSKLGNTVFSFPLLSFLRSFAQKAIYKISGVQDYYKLILKDDPVLKETFKKVIRQDITECLSRISCSTLFIWGKNDLVTPTKDAFLLVSQIKGARLKILKGKDHILNLRAPKELAEEITEFAAY